MDKEIESLWRITAPHFCCGIVFTDRGRVVECAPIVRYMRSWDSQRVFHYCKRKGWKLEQAKKH